MEIECKNNNDDFLMKGLLIFILDLSPGKGLRIMINNLAYHIFPWLDRDVACAVVTTEGNLIGFCSIMNRDNKKRLTDLVRKLSSQSFGNIRKGIAAAYEVVAKYSNKNYIIDIFLLTDKKQDYQKRNFCWLRKKRIAPAC